MKTLRSGMATDSASAPRSRVSEKLASRNGPRHSVYWVQCKRTSTDPTRSRGSTTRSSVTDMGASAGSHVEYTVTGKYTGDWLDGAKHGYGVFEYANGAKYEGEWQQDARQGRGTFWVEEKKKLRKQYAGEWHDDKRHGMGTFFFEDGGRYDGDWVRNKREGQGRMIYADQSVYEGQWYQNERSGHGVLLLANGDRYEGHWLHDKKEGPGRFFYKATRKMYVGEWVDGSPKCGSYHDDTGAAERDEEEDEDQDGRRGGKAGSARFELPEIGLRYPERVVSESIAHIRQERILEQAFRAHQLASSDEYDEEAEERGHDAGVQQDGQGESSVIFDDETMRVLQRQFQTLERTNGTIACESLPVLLDAVGLNISDDQILAFLDEIGATSQTAISFAECVDIVSLLAESEGTDANEPGLDEQDDEDEE